MQSDTPRSQSKPPYLLGLLCFIPLFGAFVGIGLLLYGIIKYKDKWLSMIGAFGILFSVAVYSFLFYYMKHGDLPKKQFEEISQIQLNTLVKYIEFYRLQHEHYPDSLPQLLGDDNLAPTTDAIQLNQDRPNDSYNYQKVGDNYVLFSSGQDGIPRTPDDLFPQVSNSESSKIGLLRPK